MQRRIRFAIIGVGSVTVLALIGIEVDPAAPRAPIFLNGLLKEESTFRKLGFTGVLDDSGTKLVPWAELRSKLEDMCQQLKQDSTPQ